MPLELIPHTRRRKMTKPRAAKIFLSRNGICFNCGRQIAQFGEPWFIEHPDSVGLGGSDNDEDLWPSHYDCKPEKDAADAKMKAKRDRLVTASYVPEGERRSNWPSQRLGNGNNQRTATRPIVRKADR
jgi:hypothetical protein